MELVGPTLELAVEQAQRAELAGDRLPLAQA